MRTDFSDATLKINLGAIKQNYNTIKDNAKTAKCASVVKADAYGVGIKEVAPALLDVGCKNFFVATLDEAIELREILKNEEIFVLNGVKQNEENEFLGKNLIPVLSAVYQIEVWNKFAVSTNQKLPAIIHIDTGMNRLGIRLNDAKLIAENKFMTSNIQIKYIMSHLANTRQVTHPGNLEQLKKFKEVKKLFPDSLATLSNSGGIFIGESYHFDMVRPGSALYGISSVVGIDMKLKPVANVTAKIINIQHIDSDGAVGYSSTHQVKKGDKIAIIPVGYADGYIRSLSNRGYVYISGFKAPVIGRISMDMITVNVSEIPDNKLEIGREVELLGQYIKIDELADLAGTIGYEVMTSLGKRYKRVYIK